MNPEKENQHEEEFTRSRFRRCPAVGFCADHAGRRIEFDDHKQIDRQEGPEASQEDRQHQDQHQRARKAVTVLSLRGQAHLPAHMIFGTAP